MQETSKPDLAEAIPGFLITDIFAAEEIRSAGPQLAAIQSDLALAFVVLVEGLGAALSSEPKKIVPGAIGVIGAVLLAAAGLVVMESDFTLGAYGASAVAGLIGVSYVFRLLQFENEDSSESNEEAYEFFNDEGERLPSPVGAAITASGWPKEYIAFNLSGCLFGAACFISATNYI
eukprot:CAMPEP_0171621996 /NCGR_PEP_ID=MMETSP0990-20121206/16962_1 /TAXON_ID=483369 /ORGANISM="non described non described, Strain CCMP2098" /LENGTH=175 /DNA_ID=CAMNT_0012187673 /DNA_START=205 /DNA_END=733 /DNA_ORIENTATION=+